MKYSIIMAAGKGTRMNSNLPKVLHKVNQTSMIEHLVEKSKNIGAERVISVVGYGHDKIEELMKDKCEFALQEDQLGTGHAVMQVKSLEGLEGKTLVVNGDCPCVSEETLESIYKALDEADMVVLSAQPLDARSYGRIVKDDDGFISKIVEYKDASEKEKAIKEINTGIYGFNNKLLFEYLPEITNDNAQKEYYITDLVAIFIKHNKRVKSLLVEDYLEVAGINDKVELAQANKYMQRKINEKFMQEGVNIIDPEITYISKDAKFGRDVTIYPNVYIEGASSIGDNTQILPQTFIKNSTIGKDCVIDSSHIIDSHVKDECSVGPYAHLRMNTCVESKNRIGNFVEFKNTNFGYDSRCAHLTYLGDSDIGSNVNIGCGVVTVNYDGKNKYRTQIDDGAFIGSNSNLIAPISIGKDAVVAAGSTINKDVKSGDMAIARSRQEVKDGYGKKYKNK